MVYEKAKFGTKIVFVRQLFGKGMSGLVMVLVGYGSNECRYRGQVGVMYYYYLKKRNKTSLIGSGTSLI